MNSQTLNFDGSRFMLDKLIMDRGRELQTYERFNVGCKPDICSLYDTVVLERIVCKDLCYIGKEDENNINDYLIRG